MIFEGVFHMAYGSHNSLRLWFQAHQGDLRPWFQVHQGDQHMLRVYNYRAAGLGLAGIVAHLTAYSAFHAAVTQNAFLTPFVWLLLVAALGLAGVLCLEIEEVGFLTAEAVFWGFWALAGLSVGCIAMVYIGTNVAPVFFTAGATFAAMSLYGYTSGTDLSKVGSFLVMGLMGVVFAGIVNIFLASTPLQFAISVIGVIAFVGLTAWETQCGSSTLQPTSTHPPDIR